MAQINSPEKKDNLGQAKDIFEIGKGIYDIKNGMASAPSSAMGRRAQDNPFAPKPPAPNMSYEDPNVLNRNKRGY